MQTDPCAPTLIDFVVLTSDESERAPIPVGEANLSFAARQPHRKAPTPRSAPKVLGAP